MTVERVELVPEANIQLKPDLNQEVFSGQKFLEEAVYWFEAFSSDLKTKNLAYRYLQPLVSEMIASGCSSGDETGYIGSLAFYRVARDLLGPLHAAYVDEVLRTAKDGDVLLFAARDATPFYLIAETLIQKFPGRYSNDLILVHVDWNRWFMGQEDETEEGKKPLSLNHPLMQKFYSQMGFGSGRLVKIVEPGAWGSAANALKTNMPEQPFELWFLFSHMPDRIYGFLNAQAPGLPEEVYEVINDTGEALPKSYLRPENLIEVSDGSVSPDFSGKWIPNRVIQTWAQAARNGSMAAAVNYKGQVDVKAHVAWLAELSKEALVEEVWTGMLPENTLTWTEGEEWKAKWLWGKIPPLK